MKRVGCTNCVATHAKKLRVKTHFIKTVPFRVRPIIRKYRLRSIVPMICNKCKSRYSWASHRCAIPAGTWIDCSEQARLANREQEYAQARSIIATGNYILTKYCSKDDDYVSETDIPDDILETIIANNNVRDALHDYLIV